MEDKEKQKYISALQKRGVHKLCPRCNQGTFELVCTSHIMISTKVGELNLGGPSIPVAIVVCATCGYVMQHALGPLDLMPDQKKEVPK